MRYTVNRYVLVDESSEVGNTYCEVIQQGILPVASVFLKKTDLSTDKCII